MFNIVKVVMHIIGVLIMISKSIDEIINNVN